MIAHYEDNAIMGMQPNAWMTKWLFRSWISHFIACLRKGPGVDLNNKHLLIIDGHQSHVTLEIVRTVMESGVNIISLPSHTSHVLQPLDVVCFKPFRTAFRKHRDAWTLLNKKKVGKQDLYEWTSIALLVALTLKNIKAGFWKIGIYPLDRAIAKVAMAPSAGFKDKVSGSGEEGKSPDVEHGIHVGGSPTPGQCGGDASGRAHYVGTTTY